MTSQNKAADEAPQTATDAKLSAGDSKGYILLDLFLVLLPLFLGVGAGAVFDIQNIGLLAVLVSVLAATWRLRRRDLSWRDLGLRRPEHWGKTALWVVASYVGVFVVIVWIANPLIKATGLGAPDVSRFDNVAGNLPVYLFWLGVSWSFAAFGEEMVARAFLINRFADLFGRAKVGWILAVIAQAALFGLAHAYQGAAGILVTGAIGLVFGFVYLGAKRNLWALILAHGLIDSIGITVLYSGQTPGFGG